MRAVGCCLLLILGGSQGLRVHFGFTLEPDDYVTFIQDFGAESGQYEVSLDVSADGCDGSSNASSGECAWAGTEGLYLLVLTADQRQQLRDRITEARSSLTGKAECFQLAAAQMELNVQRWIESRSPNRSDAIPAPAIGSALNFSTAGSFPERIERYTLAAFHCKRERTVRIRIEGNAHFLGKAKVSHTHLTSQLMFPMHHPMHHRLHFLPQGGELLSIPERTELNVLGALLVLATIATLALAYFSVRRRGESWHPCSCTTFPFLALPPPPFPYLPLPSPTFPYPPPNPPLPPPTPPKVSWYPCSCCSSGRSASTTYSCSRSSRPSCSEHATTRSWCLPTPRVASTTSPPTWSSLISSTWWALSAPAPLCSRSRRGDALQQAPLLLVKLGGGLTGGQWGKRVVTHMALRERGRGREGEREREREREREGGGREREGERERETLRGQSSSFAGCST